MQLLDDRGIVSLLFPGVPVNFFSCSWALTPQFHHLSRLVVTFQNLILTLHHYWADQGCVIHQPYDLEMGAGTFHPATFLRSLGPEPWRAAYPQPCRRPTDGRYGENPNRMQHYYQYQVVLKPAPD